MVKEVEDACAGYGLLSYGLQSHAEVNQSPSYLTLQLHYLLLTAGDARVSPDLNRLSEDEEHVRDEPAKLLVQIRSND